MLAGREAPSRHSPELAARPKFVAAKIGNHDDIVDGVVDGAADENDNGGCYWGFLVSRHAAMSNWFDRDGQHQTRVCNHGIPVLTLHTADRLVFLRHTAHAQNRVFG